VAIFWLAREKPRITIWAAIEFVALGRGGSFLFCAFLMPRPAPWFRFLSWLDTLHQSAPRARSCWLDPDQRRQG
jgi:hypothetical protein